jgi:bacteriocin biosynthesis cyclodehydratase domain-containing protein
MTGVQPGQAVDNWRFRADGVTPSRFMSRRPARRPTLLPAVRRLWRDPHRLQIGTDPGRAVILELADPGLAKLLDLLDGTYTEAALLRAAPRAGIPRAEAASILATLRAAGFVVDAAALNLSRLPEATRRRLDNETTALALRPPAGLGNGPAVFVPAQAATRIQRRLQAHVVVSGASRLAVPIACTLASSGIGHVDPSLDGMTKLTDAAPAGLMPTDAHRPRVAAAGEALRRVAPEVEVAPLSRARATFAVLVGFTAPASLTALSYGTRRLAHLAVSVRDGTVVVGPLVRPGSSPCLNCLDLHRSDRDPDWGTIAAQLQTTPELPETVTAATILAGAAFAAEEVLTHIDGGRPTTLGATVEISAPGRTTRRQWTQHPRCGCRRRGRSRSLEPPAAQS